MRDNLYKQVSEILGGRKLALNAVTCVIAAVFVGLVAVGYSLVFHETELLSLQLLAELHPVVFVILCVILFVLSLAVCDLFAPKASGDGVKQVLEAMDLAQRQDKSKELKNILSTRVSVVKVISALLATLGASALGREGPTVQITSGVFASFARKLRRYDPTTDMQMWLIAGGAAGIAAAFNTPLGGIVFAVEELAGRAFSRLRTYVLVAVTAAGLTAQALLGPYLLLGYPQLGSFGSHSALGVVFVSMSSGVFASFMKYLIRHGRHRAKHFSRVKRYLFAGFCGLIVSGIALRYGAESMGGGIDLMSGLLFSKTEPQHPAHFMARFVATFVAAISGVAGGLLGPALALGASLGSSVSSFFAGADHNLLVIAGMVSFLAGSVMAPFTAIVLVVEMTDRHSSIFPIMIAAVIGYAASFASSRALGSTEDLPQTPH